MKTTFTAEASFALGDTGLQHFREWNSSREISELQTARRHFDLARQTFPKKGVPLADRDFPKLWEGMALLCAILGENDECSSRA